MRNLSDKGFSPNERFTNGSKKNAIQLCDGGVIRLVADYEKVIKVKNIMIRIQDQKNCDRIMFYTIQDPVLAAKLNQEWVRVRMLRRKPDHIYVFEPTTDTYLACLPRDLEPAGDVASKSAEDWKRHRHLQDLKKEHEQYRQEEYKKVLDGIDEVNSIQDRYNLPSDLSLTAGLIIPEEERRSEAASSEDDWRGASEPEKQKETQSTSTTISLVAGDLEVVAVEAPSNETYDEYALELA